MKTVLATLTAVVALTGAAAPALAQPYGPGPGRPGHEEAWSVNARQDVIERRIDRGVRRGDLTRREAFRLRAELRDIARLEDRYRRDGLSRWERRDLQQRLDRLEARTRFERHDAEHRY